MRSDVELWSTLEGLGPCVMDMRRCCAKRDIGICPRNLLLYLLHLALLSCLCSYTAASPMTTNRLGINAPVHNSTTARSSAAAVTMHLGREGHREDKRAQMASVCNSSSSTQRNGSFCSPTPEAPPLVSPMRYAMACCHRSVRREGIKPYLFWYWTAFRHRDNSHSKHDINISRASLHPKGNIYTIYTMARSRSPEYNPRHDSFAS